MVVSVPVRWFEGDRIHGFVKYTLNYMLHGADWLVIVQTRLG